MSSGFGAINLSWQLLMLAPTLQGSNVYLYNVENALLSPTINSNTFLDLTLS
jgi:hypothetical protein